MPARRATDKATFGASFWASNAWNLAVGLLVVGITYGQFAQMKETLQQYGGDIKVLTERQLTNVADVRNVKEMMQNHESRIVVIERTIYKREN